MTKPTPKKVRPPKRVLSEKERMVRAIERRLENADAQEFAIRKEAQEQINKIEKRRRRDRVMLAALKQAEGI